MTITSAPDTPARSLDTFRWAIRALQKELLGFRFQYPISVHPTVDFDESLAYHLQSDRLFSDGIEMDLQGIPMQRSRMLGLAYNPAYVAWYGLMNLNRVMHSEDSANSRVFLNQVEWLVDHAVRRNDGAVVWPYNFDWKEGHSVLKAPWISAMAQGLAMSTLIRGYRITRRQELLDLCYGASRVFEVNIEEGGVRTVENDHVLYEEYPAHPLPRVLDGFLFALLGLYDLSAETKDTKIWRLFMAGIDGLKHTLPFWNYRSKWSWYGSHGYLCPPHYHALNRALLSVLARLSDESSFIGVAESWNPTRLLTLDKLEIFLVFTLTKNVARIRFSTGPGTKRSTETLTHD